MLKPGLARVTNQEKRVDESHKSNFASPSLAIDQDIPRVDVTANVRQSPTTPFGAVLDSLITLDALLFDRTTVYAKHSMIRRHVGLEKQVRDLTTGPGTRWSGIGAGLVSQSR